MSHLHQTAERTEAAAAAHDAYQHKKAWRRSTRSSRGARRRATSSTRSRGRTCPRSSTTSGSCARRGPRLCAVAALPACARIHAGPGDCVTRSCLQPAPVARGVTLSYCARDGHKLLMGVSSSAKQPVRATAGSRERRFFHTRLRRSHTVQELVSRGCGKMSAEYNS
jgi:hypothetical protein